MLVEFEPDHVPGFAFAEVQDALGDLLGCDVDLVTPGLLDRHIRERVVAEAEVQYDVVR